MASFSSSSSSSSSPPYDVFPSFSGEDVRKTFLSHIHVLFERKTIKTFKDEKIQRGQTIGPELIQAIKASKISIVMLSKNYASSSWCLNELLEIMNCKETAGQKVMTIFYTVDPSDVRKQTGDFGKAFEKTCVGKTEVMKQRWRKALTDVANIAGKDSRKWDNEAKMIEKIATDVLKELNYLTISRDFDGLVGIEAHMAKLNSLLCLESNEARMVGIWGPAGIGKTTLAKILYNRLSGNFQLSCFMENIGRTSRTTRLDQHGIKLHLQKWFLSKVLNVEDLEIPHLGVVWERLNHLKVLIILDGVDKKEQLEALAAQIEWFGFGSRIIVTTYDKSILNAYDINHVYEMDFPSKDEALQIFCQSAFKQSSPPDGFHDLAKEVADLACDLPLGLAVLGSFLQGMNKKEWTLALPRLITCLNGKIEEVLIVGYDSLDEKDQAIFRHIACLFNYEYVDSLISLLDDRDMAVEHGLNALAKKCLIVMDRWIKMHDSLQQVGREIVRKQSISKPGKREFLVDREDIEDVLTNNSGRENVLGIALRQKKTMDELFVSGRAFERMTNLRFLRFEGSYFFQEIKIHLPQGVNYLPRKLRLLHWDQYPMKSLPPSFCLRHLVELIMKDSKLEKLWEGTKALGNLKKMDLSRSMALKEIPDLSKATNLETLKLNNCYSLITLPSSIQHLNKLASLEMSYCIKLEFLPHNINLKSLRHLKLEECEKLRCFPDISQNIEYLYLQRTAIGEVPSFVVLWSHLTRLNMSGCKNLKHFPHVPKCIAFLDLSDTGIEEVPLWIQNLLQLRQLNMRHCKKLTSISSSISKLEHLGDLDFSGCTNLESVPAKLFESFSRVLRLSKLPIKSLPGFLQEKASPFLMALDLSYNDFESIPNCLKFLSKLKALVLCFCTKLVALPELPDSLLNLSATGCQSLESISHSFNNPNMELVFTNCFKLNREARELIHQSVCRYAYLPGREMPAFVTHRASGSSLTIKFDKCSFSGVLKFKPCLVFSSRRTSVAVVGYSPIKCHIKGTNGDDVLQLLSYVKLATAGAYGEYARDDHIIVLDPFIWPNKGGDLEVELSHNKKMLEFDCYLYEIRESGVQILDSAYVCEKNGSYNNGDFSMWHQLPNE